MQDLISLNGGLISFSSDIYVNLVIIVLMMLGGLGFFVIEDIIKCIKKKSIIHMQFHTKIILLTSLIIYIVSIILIKIAEPNLTALQTLFLGATLRTTGFSTIDMSQTSSLCKMICSIFMLVGGGPASTSGGIKITSFAVMIFTMKAVIENKSEVVIFYKKIDSNTIKKAVANIMLNCILILIAIIICNQIQDLGLINILFMCISALAATGLSVVEASGLTLFIKIILMVLMIIGRVGILSFVSIFALNKKENQNIEYVNGDLIL